MSIARVRSFAFSGIDAVPVEVQVQIAGGLPAFLIVGLPDKTVGEARERVRATLTAMGLAMPPKRVLINLAPASLLKEGSHFDLPIALCILAAMDVLPREEIGGYAALGELSLDGSLLPVPGVLPAAMGASELDLGLICPASQGGEAAWAGRIEVLASPDLLGILNHFRGQQVLAPPQPAGLMESPPSPDLSDIRGLETARRALEISAAGSHNLLLIGPPGAGKSMLASRLPGLLPDLTPAEALEVSMVHSVAGLLQGGRLVMRPPLREPHHSASQAALSGGGQRARPGEVSLAHRGVLFLDELPEFPPQALEALRGPADAPPCREPAPTSPTLPGPVPARGRDEPLPLRPSRQQRRRMQPRATLRRGLHEPHLRPPARPHRPVAPRAARDRPGAVQRPARRVERHGGEPGAAGERSADAAGR